ncbi:MULTISPECIES: YugN-like family protein [Alteribacter]|uniref:YugN-like family protein n=1 Tax=Alteribacter keqinensis TaxID=2483800 RepID=A0A3M7TY15_9BACI|nr:YugN-like family protein [Alteribacter keqinensis]MBM7096274.1 YugN-like family protein [Alteribacter salitolerans]RNA70500.1 hypothetical protein EBO34_11425 [Alteribacter keqinensis]
MIEVQSPLENQEYELIELEQKLKPLGYVIGGGWEYDHGYFDYVMNDESSYLCVRLPFFATDGELDRKGVEVQLGRPFLLAHKYQRGLDDNVQDPNPLTNQFSEPQDPDAEFPEEWIKTGKEYIKELEQVILHDMQISPRN